jgi:predicted  nucleic acid-binding Zn-ribbon protein
VAVVIAALWALAKRMQVWKEHIVTVMSAMEANNAHAHDVTRTMIWKNKEALSTELAALRKDVSALREQLEPTTPEESQPATNR